MEISFKKQTSRMVIIGIILILSLSLISAISYPQAFYGGILIKDGKNPDGKILTGKVNGDIVGSCTISNNQYGLTIGDYNVSGEIIKFYIEDEESEESWDFAPFELTELNLTFNTVSSDDGNPPPGSGGGGGSSNSRRNNQNKTINLPNNPEKTEKNQTNEKENKEDKVDKEDNDKKAISGITGAVIGYAKTRVGIGILIAIGILIIGGIIIFKRKDKED